MNMKIQRCAYICNGKPKCHFDTNCGLYNFNGECTHTTDISYAKNRKLILYSDEYKNNHLKKVSDSDTEEWYFEEV